MYQFYYAPKLAIPHTQYHVQRHFLLYLCKSRFLPFHVLQDRRINIHPLMIYHLIERVTVLVHTPYAIHVYLFP